MKQKEAEELLVGLRQIHDEAEAYSRQIRESVENLAPALKQIETNRKKIEDFDNFYEDIFEDGDAGVCKKTKLIEQEKRINKLEDALKDLLESSQKKFDELYTEKEKTINELLPGATTVGLAKAYKDEKNELENKKKIWIWLFGVSITLFMVLSTVYFYRSYDDGFSYVSIFRLIPIYAFATFFIYYTTKQLSIYSRLENEYAHKQRLNESYVGYRGKIGKDEALSVELKQIMLASARHNPSEIFDKARGETAANLLVEQLSKLSPQQLKELVNNLQNK